MTALKLKTKLFKSEKLISSILKQKIEKSFFPILVSIKKDQVTKFCDKEFYHKKLIKI